MPVALDTSPEALARMRSNLATLDNPVEFCRRYLRLRGFHLRARDVDDLLAVAVDALVKAAIRWHDRDNGVSFTTHAYFVMDSRVLRELSRDQRRREELSGPAEQRWLKYDPSTAPFRQIEDRFEIQYLMDRANLSGVQRSALWTAAIYGGETAPVKDHAPLGELVGPVNRTAIRRIRRAVADGVADDSWATARARFQAAFEIQAHRDRNRRSVNHFDGVLTDPSPT